MELCKGYTVSNNNNPSQPLETLYAECPDGRVLSTGEVPYSYYFDKSGRKWSEVVEVPAGAEFIGTYPVPLARGAK